ncbi:two-component system, OmpR family, sensor kinase [Collimonas sp. OK607]|uniref:ATP-binding protein n=1 Tax=Collimonas sp. OK607 TaxID=1798194 RepID=UPI0008F37703|nr:ATP-binding protein [Collimonas sp. OK607]SFB17231.1 two-component system, OmpR family, sensor kinase [Collimonas sp. OK607]
MDGFKTRLSHSLQFRLSLWLSLVILAMAVPAGVYSFFSAFHEANDLQDDQLRQVAALVLSRDLPPATPDRRATGKMKDNESKVIVQILAPAQSDGDDDTSLHLPADLRDGIQTVKVGHVPWRLFVKPTASGQRLAVGQQTEVRDEIARDSGLRTVMPFMVLIPILIALVSIMVRGMLRPIAKLSQEVDRRDDQDMRPLDEQQVADEIRPLIGSINRLLRRVADNMDAQRRFLADAAHELRSPLTALSLQAENLAATDLSPASKARLLPLRQGLNRSKALLEQLLTLARSQNTGASRISQITQVSLQAVLRRVVEDSLPLAQANQIDIGVNADTEVTLAAQEVDIVALIRNLIDNAIRYTPPGGNVEVRLHAQPGLVTVEVEDSGPGIQETERERVFDPFYRVLGSDQDGSGLGLSIVKSIVARLNGKIELQHARSDAPYGLKVIIRLPT